MLTHKNIKTTDQAAYQFIEELFINSFPCEERRELELQREFTDTNPLFTNILLLHQDKPVGFITYWNFEEFCYIEHFAISPEARNGGYGKEALLLFDKLINKPVVLEVEHPTDEMSQRRIGFYTRLEYRLWENEYMQPPYRKGDGFLPMHIMAKGDLNPERDFERIKNKIHKEVYLTE